ncbi:hypothetical protein GLOIN_2v1768806 [Rhizophagus clarus]|uniref:Uncharacterized protein n=1 Tax=Rhizophagus clarus TaxID=94130 RepID=A0A8H3R2T9_9GLOM|nr:hypothetical protein GLOIN_2v1768806 [Rhizophagus clarus]
MQIRFFVVRHQLLKGSINEKITISGYLDMWISVAYKIQNIHTRRNFSEDDKLIKLCYLTKSVTWIQEAISSEQLRNPEKPGTTFLKTFLIKDGSLPESDDNVVQIQIVYEQIAQLINSLQE